VTVLSPGGQGNVVGSVHISIAAEALSSWPSGPDGPASLAGEPAGLTNDPPFLNRRIATPNIERIIYYCSRLELLWIDTDPDPYLCQAASWCHHQSPSTAILTRQHRSAVMLSQVGEHLAINPGQLRGSAVETIWMTWPRCW
jgi:hypothetical protein